MLTRDHMRKHRVLNHYNDGDHSAPGEVITPKWRGIDLPFMANERKPLPGHEEIDERVRKLLDY